jgi:hypothetical protein
MEKRIIYPTNNGGVAVIVPAPQARRQLLVSDAEYEDQTNENGETVTVCIKDAVYRQETDEEFLAWVAKKDVPAGVEYKIVDVTEVPSDRTFRDAWEYET